MMAGPALESFSGTIPQTIFDNMENDRIGLVKELYKMSNKNFDEIVNIMPEYKQMTALVSSYYQNQNNSFVWLVILDGGLVAY